MPRLRCLELTIAVLLVGQSARPRAPRPTTNEPRRCGGRRRARCCGPTSNRDGWRAAIDSGIANVTLAKNLSGTLMLVVGEIDQNVDPASTMQVANALIRADKDFDLLVIPGAGHGAGESPYGRRRRQDFFVRHLLVRSRGRRRPRSRWR